MHKFKLGDIVYRTYFDGGPIRKVTVVKRRGRSWDDPHYDIDVHWRPGSTYRDTVPEKQLLTYDEAIAYRLAGKT